MLSRKICWKEALEKNMKTKRANEPGQSAVLLLDVIDVLRKLNVSYAVVGAMAASFYGTVRASMDADAVIAFEKSKGGPEELLDELKKTGFDVSQRKGSMDDPVMGVIDIQDCYKNRVDLLTGIRGLQTDAFLRVVTSPFMDAHIQIIGIEDFIAMKIFAGGPKDIEDVRNALQVSTEKIDVNLLKKLTLNYGNSTFQTLEALLKSAKAQ